MPDSFITRCPNCKTCFRVAPNKLPTPQGQVRCGRCAFVFVALDHRVETEPAEPLVSPPPLPQSPPLAAEPPVAQPTETLPPADIPAMPSLLAPQPTPGEAELDGAPPRQYELPLEVPAAPLIAAPAPEPTLPAYAEPPAESAEAAPPAVADLPEPAADATVDPAHEAVPQPTLAEVAAEPLAEPAPPAPATDAASLLTDYQVAAADKHKGVDFTAQPVPIFDKPRRGPVWLWAFGCLLLTVLAVGQVAREYRGDLLLSHPELRPHLQMLCDYTRCTLELPRKIEWITIEASDLQNLPDNPRIAVLNAILRNRAAYTQALPKLELALTDPQEQAMVRRAITPAEYLSKKTAPAIAANQEIVVKVSIDLKDVQANGYRLAVFY